MKEEIFKRLDALAEKLGVAANYLFRLYVQQARVEVIEDIVTGVIAVLLFYAGYKSLTYYVRGKNDDSRIPFGIGGPMLMTVGVIIFVVFLSSDIWTATMNPQFWAVHQILHDIRGGQ